MKYRSRKYTSITQIIKIANQLFTFIENFFPLSPFEEYFTSVSIRPLFKAVPSRISRWRPCFHYTAQCPVLDHTVFHLFLSLSLCSFRSSLSRAGSYSCSTFCKSSDISTGMRSTFNLAPVNERTLISLLRVSRVRDSGVASWVLRYAHNKPLAFRHRAR